MNDKKQLQNSSNTQNQNEEVDLGILFKVIGNGIKNIINSIGFFFLRVYHYFILVLIFIKRQFIKLTLAIIVGAVIGLAIEYNKPKEYNSQIILETNFGSGIQLYKQIHYLTDLINKKDSLSLSQVLNLPINEVKKITAIDVTAYRPKRNLLLSYDEYIKKTDSIYTKGITVKDFEKRLDEYDFRYHEILVKSYSSTIFIKLTPEIIRLVENSYFKNSRDIKSKELKQKFSVLQKNLIQIDSLRSLYKEIDLLKANNQTSKSTIEFSQKEEETIEKDIKLFEISNQILSQLSWLNDDILRTDKIVNIISDFEAIGVLDKNILNKKYFQLAALLGSLMLLWILSKQLNNYLENYS
jgi:hypothetical protein